MRCKVPDAAGKYPDKENATILTFFKTGGLVLVDGKEWAQTFDWNQIKFLIVKL